VPQHDLDEFEFYGELGMNGELHPIPGALPAAIKAGEAGKAVFGLVSTAPRERQ
jgi:predicted ATPase with chaperone activity